MTARLPFGLDPHEPNPDWSQAGEVHDWRNHVRENTRRIWPKLTPEQRIAIAIDAEELASKEEWD